MQLTNFTDYGLRCLMYLAARQGQISTVKEISDYFGISRNHLVKVVHRLSQLKLIISNKGKGGGLRLACGSQDLKLGDVVVMLETNMNLVPCFNPQITCQIANTCQLRHYLFEAGQAFISVLNKYTIADISKNQETETLIQIQKDSNKRQ